MTFTISNYADALRYVYSFADYERTAPRSTEDLRMEGVLALLAAVGDPHKRLRAVHIAGTKGKGSTTAMIGAVLRAAGYSTGSYTSPHLHTHRERYRLGGAPVSEQTFTDLLRDLRPQIEHVRAERSLTTFEVCTALAFDLFVRERVDWAVVEVGMGGRLDTTNVLTPVLSVITSVSLDHTEVLGETVEQIAWEKAGIIKPGVPVVVARQRPEALDVILRRAAELGSPVDQAHELARVEAGSLVGRTAQEFTLRTTLAIGGRSLEGCRVRLPLLGEHQRDNALAAITACVRLSELGGLQAQKRLDLESLLRGLSETRWPGRFEVVEGRPPIVLDGAHNPDSLARLRATVAEVFEGARPAWVFGTNRGHDSAAMLAELGDGTVYLCSSTHPRATPPESILLAAAAAGLEAAAFGDVASALEAARRAPGVGVVVMCGSLFVVAEAREALGLATDRDPVTH